jgi:DNA polymerase-1
MRKYKTTYHRVNEWLQDAGNLAYRRGFSETMYGRKRFFTRPQGGPNFENEVASLKRQGANAAIQGTSADITKLAMLNLYHDLSNYHYDANIILQVHDEIGVLAHKREAESVKSLVEESMTQSAQELLKNVPVKVDAYVGDIWKKGE